MQFTEIGKTDGKTLLLLPGTGCTWQTNFHNVQNELSEKYHLICVNYDGFEGDREKPFTDMITVTEKIEKYIIEHHNGKLNGAYGSSLGGSFVGLLIQRRNVHINHGFIGSSDLDQGNKVIAKIATLIIGRSIANAAKNQKNKEKLKTKLQQSFGMETNKETSDFMDMFADGLISLHPKTVTNEFYSDYITPLQNNIHADGTKVHIIYALKMGVKYEKRYLKHFQNPDIRRFDMQHEAWLFEEKWKIPVLETIYECMQEVQK